MDSTCEPVELPDVLGVSPDHGSIPGSLKKTKIAPPCDQENGLLPFSLAKSAEAEGTSTETDRKGKFKGGKTATIAFADEPESKPSSDSKPDTRKSIAKGRKSLARQTPNGDEDDDEKPAFTAPASAYGGRYSLWVQGGSTSNTQGWGANRMTLKQRETMRNQEREQRKTLRMTLAQTGRPTGFGGAGGVPPTGFGGLGALGGRPTSEGAGGRPMSSLSEDSTRASSAMGFSPSDCSVVSESPTPTSLMFRQSVEEDQDSVSPNASRFGGVSFGEIMETEEEHEEIEQADAYGGNDYDSDESDAAVPVDETVETTVLEDTKPVPCTSCSGRPCLRHDHMRGSLSQYVFKGGKEPDSCCDWRFLSSQEFHKIKESALKNGRSEALRKLIHSVQKGTEQSCEHGSYPVSREECEKVMQENHPDAELFPPLPGGRRLAHREMVWVELWKLRHEVPRMTWFTDRNSALPSEYDYEPCAGGNLEPPMICMEGHPLCVAKRIEKHLHKLGYDKRPPIVVHMDAVFSSDGLNGDSLRPRHVGNFNEEFFLRTDLLEFLEESTKRLQIAANRDRTTMKEHLCASDEPALLHCEDVVLMRGNGQDGYPFMPNPMVIDGLLVGALHTERPMTRRYKDKRAYKFTTGYDNDFLQNPQYGKEYSNDDDLKAVTRRMMLVVNSCLTAHVEPILVMMVPGIHDGRFHPFYSVLQSLCNARLKRGRLFSAMVLACGDQQTAVVCDQLVNHDLYCGDGSIRRNWNMPFVNQYPEMCETLCTLSINPLWNAEDEAERTSVAETKERTTTLNPEKPPSFYDKFDKEGPFTKFLRDAMKDGKIAALITAQKTKTTKFLALQEAQYECDHLAEIMQDKLEEERKNLRRRRAENGGRLGTRKQQMLDASGKAYSVRETQAGLEKVKNSVKGSICIASKRKSSLYDFAKNPRQGPGPGLVRGNPENLLPLCEDDDEPDADGVAISFMKQWAVTRQAQAAGVVTRDRESIAERKSRLSLRNARLSQMGQMRQSQLEQPGQPQLCDALHKEASEDSASGSAIRTRSSRADELVQMQGVSSSGQSSSQSAELQQSRDEKALRKSITVGIKESSESALQRDNRVVDSKPVTRNSRMSGHQVDIGQINFQFGRA